MESPINDFGDRGARVMNRMRTLGLILLTLTGIYLYAFPSATIPYLGIVLGHIAGGLVFALLLLLYLRRLRQEASAGIAGWIFITIGTALGIALAFTGASRPLTPLLYAHIFICAAGVLFLLTQYAGRRGWRSRS